jgi:hypothetical protein
MVDSDLARVMGLSRIRVNGPLSETVLVLPFRPYCLICADLDISRIIFYESGAMTTKSWGNTKGTRQGGNNIIQETEAGTIKETPIYIDERTSGTMYVRSPMDHNAEPQKRIYFERSGSPVYETGCQILPANLVNTTTKFLSKVRTPNFVKRVE